MHYYYSHFNSIKHPKGTEKENKNFEIGYRKHHVFCRKNNAVKSITNLLELVLDPKKGEVRLPQL